MKIPCTTCGRVEPKHCGTPGCPYFAGRPRTFKHAFTGATPNLFIGQWGYPDVRVGILAAEDATGTDDPKGWTARQTPIPTIIDHRASLINSQFTANIRSFRDRFLQDAQLIAQSQKAVDIEVTLKHAPAFRITYPDGTQPHGANVQLVQERLTENVRIPRHVDKAVSDTDLHASTAVAQLYGKVDEYALVKLLTAGVLGRGTNRRLVPTRWGITAVDDTLGKNLLEQVRTLPVLDEPCAYFGGHYGNTYAILFFPRHWQFELFEFLTTAAPGTTRVWTDDEPYSGRTTYARDTAGGYYAARLPILEHLLARRRQAAVLCLRFVTGEYTNPLGVWVVREAVRIALATTPLRFSTEELLTRYAAARAARFGVRYEEEVRGQSKLLHRFQQRSLSEFSP